MVTLAGIAMALIGFAGVGLAIVRGAEEREQARHLGRCRAAMDWTHDMEGKA